LAEAVKRNSREIETHLHALSERRTASGEPDNVGVNGVVNTLVTIRGLLDENLGGSVTALADRVVQRVTSSVQAHKRVLAEEVVEP
jgi:hypothetical protein